MTKRIPIIIVALLACASLNAADVLSRRSLGGAAAPPAAGATLVQSKSYTGPGGEASHSITFDSTPAAGNVVVVGFSTSGEDPTAITDNKSNVYQRYSSATGSYSESAIFVSTNIASSTTFTVTATPTSGDYINIVAMEWSGLKNQAPNASAVSTSSSIAISPTESSVLIGYMTHDGTSSPTITVTDGGTLIYESETTSTVPQSAHYRNPVAAGATKVEWVLSPSFILRAGAIAMSITP